ncbi:hypothetical protein, partial [Pseudomonas simiae]|uniref:hypothetical protein n=1 Tax=Pseudomonas simiae TaxID=321846 RepID=UPI001F482B72
TKHRVHGHCGPKEDLTAVPHDNHAPTGSGRFFCFLKIPPDNKKSKCGDGLARESTGSVSTCFPGTPLSRASPPPQGKASNLKILCKTLIQSGIHLNQIG